MFSESMSYTSSDDDDDRRPASYKRVTIHDDATDMDSLLPSCVAGLLWFPIFYFHISGIIYSDSVFSTDAEDSIDDVGPPISGVKVYPQTRASRNYTLFLLILLNSAFLFCILKSVLTMQPGHARMFLRRCNDLRRCQALFLRLVHFFTHAILALY